MDEARRIPGEWGVWVLIGGELLGFSLFFLTLAHFQGAQPEVYAQSQETLDQGIGLANTLILLTSSLFVAMGVRRVRLGREGAAALFRAGLGCGILFAALKAVEYTQKIAAGLTPLRNEFYVFYFAFTGIHLAHVIVGSAVLAWMAILAGRAPSDTRTLIVECGALFWHLVDLLWIMLFALFYLAGSRG